MKKMITLLAALTLLTGLSVAEGAVETAVAPLPIEGNWGMRMEQNGLTFDMTFSIQNQSLTLTNVCTFQGRSAVARVSTPANYDDRTLTTLGYGRADEFQNGVNCNVSVQPQRMNYIVSGNMLTLSMDGHAEQFVLIRK